MNGLDDLLAVFQLLEDRARFDPRLDAYRISGRPDLVSEIPHGWFLSDCMSHIALNGGWWPGEWMLRDFDESTTVKDVLVNGLATEKPTSVRWVTAGSVWEQDYFYTPLLRRSAVSAPLFGFSGQALWTSMVFPDVVAILQSFVVAYDEMGFDPEGLSGFRDESGQYKPGVDPFFVEWVTGSPGGTATPAKMRVRERLGELAKSWTSDHPCWVSDAMPLLSDGPWPPNICAAVLGVDEADL